MPIVHKILAKNLLPVSQESVEECLTDCIRYEDSRGNFNEKACLETMLYIIQTSNLTWLLFECEIKEVFQKAQIENPGIP